MRLDDFQREALRTATPITDFTVGPHLSCAALGLCEESAELLGVLDGDADAAEKEAGDVLWYLALLAGCLNLRLSELCHATDLEGPTFKRILANEDETRYRLRLMARAGDIAGAVKKVVHHRAGIPSHLGTMRSAAFDMFEILAALSDNQPSAWTLDSAAARNVAKLRARYPDGWTAHAAAARADERTPQRDAASAPTSDAPAPCAHCGAAPVIERGKVFRYTCPACCRAGCDTCMPAGAGCVCPECEESGE